MKFKFSFSYFLICQIFLIVFFLIVVSPVSVQAKSNNARDAAIAELKAAVQALQVEQMRAQARIAELEAALVRQDQARQAVTTKQAPSTASATTPVVSTQVSTSTTTTTTSPAQARIVPVAADTGVVALPSRFMFSGDMRVRYESNFGVKGVRNRDRGVLRARLRAAYAVNDWLAVGGQLATGDPDDPNSTDITLSGFDDDLQVSLDQAYLRLAPGDFQAYLGKFPQPFARTELVWDVDVSPQGASASYATSLGDTKLKASALYFIVDEAVAGPDSRMIGGQIAMETPPAFLQGELAVGYYDYSLRSVAGAAAGDFRSNQLVNGRYLSDFDLLDIIAVMTWRGFGERWPVRFIGDYVHNFGAATKANTGFGTDLQIGRANQQGDWRFTYGYAQTETDAVLAAFSHDNTNQATNYLQHTLAIDYILRPNVALNATYYRYRQKDVPAGFETLGWQNRLRLNFMAGF